MYPSFMAPPAVIIPDARPPLKLTETVPLHVWAATHRDHGRAGPWYDAKIGDYHTWRCSCGERWQATQDEIERVPERCALKAVT